MADVSNKDKRQFLDACMLHDIDTDDLTSTDDYIDALEHLCLRLDLDYALIRANERLRWEVLITKYLPYEDVHADVCVEQDQQLHIAICKVAKSIRKTYKVMLVKEAG